MSFRINLGIWFTWVTPDTLYSFKTILGKEYYLYYHGLINMNWTAIIITGTIALFVVLPKIIFDFIRKSKLLKKEEELEKLKYQREILELEIKKQLNEIKMLEDESKKYDKIINGN